MSNQLVGIGISQDGMSLAHFIRQKKDYVLQHTSFAPVTTIPAMKDQINQWVKSFDLKDAVTNIVLDSSKANLLLTEAPEVEDSELVRAMQWQLKENPEIDVDDSVIDCFSIPGQRERGRQPMAYVVSAKKDDVKPLANICMQSQLDLKSIDIPAMTQRNLAALLPEDEFGVAMLSFSAKQGLLSVSRKGNLYLARDIDVGFDDLNITPAIEDESGLSLEAASTSSDEHILEMVVLEIQRSMDYYERYFGQPPIQNLIIAPLPKPVPDMTDYIASQLGIKVRELNLNEVLHTQAEELVSEQQYEYLTAIGASLRFFQAS